MARSAHSRPFLYSICMYTQILYFRYRGRKPGVSRYPDHLSMRLMHCSVSSFWPSLYRSAQTSSTLILSNVIVDFGNRNGLLRHHNNSYHPSQVVVATIYLKVSSDFLIFSEDAGRCMIHLNVEVQYSYCFSPPYSSRQ